MRVRRGIAGFGVGTLALAGLLAPGPAAQAAPPGRTYVALGDSYTSAPGVPPAAKGAPARCNRSGGNYPHRVARALDLSLIDVSCSGADVTSLWRPQGGKDVPPQLAALRKDTDLVTVGIGGNDNGLFTRVIVGCGKSAVKVLTGTLTPCRDTYGDAFAKSIADDAPRIRAALREIKKRSPGARVLVVGYPALLPTDPIGQAQCLASGIPFSPGDLSYMDEIERKLNAMLAAAARSVGATFVDTYTGSVGHDMCRLPGIRWIEPVIALAEAASYHPNADGQAAVGKAVEAVLR